MGRPSVTKGPPVRNVLLFVGSNRYDVGSFTVQRYETPVLYMVRLRSNACTTLLPATTTPPPRVSQGDSILEDLYRQLFAAWELGANYNRVMYHLDEDSASTVTWYTPDGYLYDVLSDGALDWCGAMNRHGRHCLLEIKPVYPAQDVFHKLRTLATKFNVAVLLVYGRPDVVPTDERMSYGNLHRGGRTTPSPSQYSVGCMGILFRPADGVTRRVHFYVEGDRVVLMLGEVGEFGPIHAMVISGHQAVAAQGLLPRPQ